MKLRQTFKPLTLLADAVLGLAIFLLMAGVLTTSCDGHGVRLSDVMSEAHAAHLTAPETSTVAWAQPSSHTMPLAMVTTYPGQVFRNTNREMAFLVLGTVFTMLFVANLALYRHLRSQYRSPRRRKFKAAREL